MFRKKVISIVLVCICICTCAFFANAKKNVVGYETNKNGETYGNSIQAEILGYEADLILATGEKGVLGYVRAADLDDNVSCPNDVKKVSLYKTKEFSEENYIPLYDKDGKTVLGRFQISIFDDEMLLVANSSDYAYGQAGNINVSGHYSCTTQSGIRDALGGVRGITTITSDKVVDIDWLGVQARIYKKSDGSLVRSTYFYYNDERAKGFEQDAFHGTILDEEYYSKGVVKTWNPDILAYWTTGTFQSKNIKPNQ